MAETLLTPSSIKLYGRIISSLQYSDDTTLVGGAATTIGNNNFLQHQLAFNAAATPINTTGATQANSREVILATDLGNITPGMVVTGIVPAGGGVSATQAFAPGTHIVSVTRQTEGKAAIPAFPGNPAIPATATTPAYPAAPATPLIPAIPATPASFTLSSDPLGAPANNILMVAWLLGVNFARIYAFSFEGAIYALPRPTLFLVHGAGSTIDAEDWKGGRSSLDQSGVVAREWEFSGDKHLSYWEYEKGDFSLRLDTEAGPFDQILLAAALRAGADMADRATGIRSGASVSGASLSGASLSGASLSGASLSGASLSGASLRGR
jgi:hypothetical protein